MLATIIVGLIVIGLPAFLIIFRSNAAVVILVMTACSVLVGAIGEDVQTVLKGLANPALPVASLATASLVAVPTLAIAFHYRKTSRAKWLLQIPPALLSGIFALFLTLPLLGLHEQLVIRNSKAFRYLVPYQKSALGCTIIIALLVLLAIYKKPKSSDEDGHKHKK